MKSALITGITGQDGSYLAEQLLEDGWEVHGVVRRLSTANTWRIQHIKDKLNLHSADLLDTGSLIRVIRETKPSQVYNLAAQSFVQASWEQPVLTADVTAMGVARILEAIRLVDTSIKFYQASSSEMFGRVRETPQRETTSFYPRSPYGAAKAYGHYLTVNYRESFDIFAVSGILFNHESVRRGREFVTRKVTRAAAECAVGLRTSLPMGNLDSKRDWGFAGDYVGAMRLMLEADIPEDYVIATGEYHTVKELY